MPSKRVEFKLFKRIKANGNIYIVEMKIFIVILKPKLEVDHATFKMTESLRMLLPPNTPNWSF